MSLDIRYLTNGEKTAYRVQNSGVEPIEVNYYETMEEIPKSIRHYAPKGEPNFVEPDMAYALGAGEYFYPNFTKCGMPKYKEERCIAESCKYGTPTYKDCKYFQKSDKGVID